MTSPKSQPTSSPSGPSDSASYAATQIFFDGNCIVCDLEISHYKRKYPALFEIVDISAQDFDADRFGLNREAVNYHMHVKTPEGQVLKGVDAFAHIWSRIPKMQWASRLVLSRPLKPLAAVGYEVFARNRKYLPKRIRR